MAQKHYKENIPSTRTSLDDHIHLSLVSGEETPLWEKSEATISGKFVSVGTPLLSEYSFSATTKDTVDNQEVLRSVAISTKLISHQVIGSDDVLQFQVVLIPDADYYEANKESVVDNFNPEQADSCDFSGIALYYCAFRKVLISGSWYENGKVVDAVFLYDPAADYETEFAKLTTKMGGTLIQRAAQDPETIPGYCSICQHAPCLMTDACQIVINAPCRSCGYYPCLCGLEDYFREWCPYCLTYTCDGNCRGDNGPCEKCNRYDCDGNCDTGSGDGGGGSESDGEVTNGPADCSDFFGGKEYYAKREANLLGRGFNSSGYYMEYGYKYCERFNEETREKVSEKGKVWIDKVTIGLQKSLEEIIMNDPDIEMDPDRLREAAFKSHEKVYIDAGLFDLSIVDITYIATTLDIEDLESQEGEDQFKNIAFEFIKSPDVDLWDRSFEVMFNAQKIMDIIREYAKKPNTRALPTHSYTAEKILDIIWGVQIEYFEENYPDFEFNYQ